MARTTLLSPRRYLRMGYGLATPEGYSLAQVRNALVTAQDQLNRYCNVPKFPNLFDWRGGEMLNEQHQWPIRNPLAYGPGARRTYLNVSPIKEVTAFTLDLGKTYIVQITPADGIYVNRMEGYVEIVSVNPTVVGFYPLAVNLGLYNPIARVSYSYGWSFPVEGDVLEAETPLLYSAAYGNWDRTVTPVVYFDGGAVDPANYTIDYDDGSIAFVSGQEPSPGFEVTADYTYLPPSEVVSALGIITTGVLGGVRNLQRGLYGLQSLRVAEVTITALQPSQTVTKNGVTIPAQAAALLDDFVFGSVHGLGG